MKIKILNKIIDRPYNHRDINLISLYLKLGIDINTVDEKHRSFLHYAAITNMFFLAKFLLENKIDKHIVDHLGREAVYYAGKSDLRNLIENYKGE